MFDPIPACLDEMPPGPVLAGFLASIDVDRVSVYDRVVVLRAQARMAAHYQAKVLAAMASVADHMETVEFPERVDVAWDAASTEIRAALRLTRRAAESELGLADALCRRLPAIQTALAAGAVDRARARVLVDGVAHLDQDTARAVVDEVLPLAGRKTTGELRALLQRLCIEADPQQAVQRYEHAVEQRRVWAETTTDGTAHLSGLDLPAEQVAKVMNRINHIARSLRRNGEPRTMDQLRADIYLGLLAGKEHATGGVVNLHVDLDTLAELSEAPGELAGYGPVIADLAKQVAAAQVDAEWRFTITHPDTGMPIHDGTTKRRPTAAQARTAQARTQVCYFPGCRMPASSCDLDHGTPWAERHETSSDDLYPGCRWDHIRVRHTIGWHYQPLPKGDYLWTSPLGHRYTTSGRPP